jgi:hypothetical protein
MLATTLALWALLPALATARPGMEKRQGRQSSSGPRPNSFQPAGDAGISAQMMFLGTKDKVYILDKTENNPTTIDGRYGSHPAWAVEYDINTQKVRTMDVYSNTFCAGGAVLGNGTWAVFGGNQPVTTDGVATNELAAYKTMTGGTAIRLLDPCDDERCEYLQGAQTLDINADTGGYLQMTGKRWYPTVETLADGTLIVIGGDKNGGYVNTAVQDNPTYEFFPPTDEGAVHLQFLSDTLPVNLYPLTWLLPSGKLFMQAARKTIIYDYKTKETTDLPDMPIATRVYPASAATVMLPLSSANGWQPTLLFCGGSATERWGDDVGPGYNVTAVQADNSCYRITPEGTNNPRYEQDDWMFEGRSMGEFVLMPDGNIWMGNGVAMGTAGYGDFNYSVGESYGQDPIYMPAIYRPYNEPGQRWDRTGLEASPNERMYHSTAILLPDSSILISGSNPNKDFTNNQWRSRTDVERWYPSYYNEPRPTFSGMPETFSYGGDYFNITLNGTVDAAAANTTRVTLIRGGFHTHALGFGQRQIFLDTSYTFDEATQKATIHVSQLPGTNGPNLFQPGPALAFVVVNGVPSQGEMVMIGNGKLGTQPTSANAELPGSQTVPLPQPEVNNNPESDNANTGSTNVKSDAAPVSAGLVTLALPGLVTILTLMVPAVLL